MDVIFRLSGGRRRLSAPLWDAGPYLVICFLLCGETGIYKVCPVRRRHLFSLSLRCASKYNSRACFGRLFEPRRSNLESHKRLFLLHSFFGLFFGILFPYVLCRFSPGISFRLLLFQPMGFFLRPRARIFTISPVVCPIVALLEVVSVQFVASAYIYAQNTHTHTHKKGRDSIKNFWLSTKDIPRLYTAPLWGAREPSCI